MADGKSESVQPTPNRDWLATHSEPTIDPDYPIIDAHHHLWNRPGAPYLLEDLLKDTGSGHNVTGTVFMECKAMYRQDVPPELAPAGEAEFVTGVAAMSASGEFGPTRACLGMVAYADLRLGARVDEVLGYHRRIAGRRFKGVRNIAAWHGDASVRSSVHLWPQGLMADPKFREGFGRLEDWDLSFDTYLYHTQIDELTALAGAFPGVRIVLDHVGGPIGIGPYGDRRAEVFTEWRNAMRRLSGHPNVCVKLGGLGMRIGGFEFHSRQTAPDSQTLADAWRPYIETAIDLFGPSRCMFESNFPVDKISCSYNVLWNAFKRLAANYTDAEKGDLFRGTATSVYPLNEDPWSD